MKRMQWVDPSKTRKGEEEVERWQAVAKAEGDGEVFDAERTLAIVERLDVLWAEMAHLLIRSHVSLANDHMKRTALKIFRRVGNMESKLRASQEDILHAGGFDGWRPEEETVRPDYYRNELA